MFETLEDMAEKSRPLLDRGYPILLYSGGVVLSSIALILEGRDGFSPGQARLMFSLVGWVVMFLLSLTWLVASLRSTVPITRRDLWVRFTIL